LVGEALANNALQRQLCPLGIVHAQPDAEAIPEVELSKVAMQSFTVLLDAAQG
jgi:hypothetical protein